MDNDKIGFVMYKDYKEYFSFLSKEDKADVIDAVMEYAFGEAETAEAARMSPVAALAFAFIKNQIDRDAKKYEKACENRRKNGALGGRPKKAKAEEPEQGKETHEEEEKAREKNESTESADGFSEFWEEYPKKTDKTEAKKAFFALSLDREDREALMECLRKKKISEGWQVEGGRFVPRASVWISRKDWEKQRDGPSESRGSFETDVFFEAALRKSYES